MDSSETSNISEQKQRSAEKKLTHAPAEIEISTRWKYSLHTMIRKIMYNFAAGTGLKVKGDILHECRWGSQLPLLRLWDDRWINHWSQCNAKYTLTFPAAGNHHLLTRTKLYCLVKEAHVCKQRALAERPELI